MICHRTLSPGRPVFDPAVFDGATRLQMAKAHNGQPCLGSNCALWVATTDEMGGCADNKQGQAWADPALPKGGRRPTDGVEVDPQFSWAGQTVTYLRNSRTETGVVHSVRTDGALDVHTPEGWWVVRGIGDVVVTAPAGERATLGISANNLSLDGKSPAKTFPTPTGPAVDRSPAHANPQVGDLPKGGAGGQITISGSADPSGLPMSRRTGLADGFYRVLTNAGRTMGAELAGWRFKVDNGNVWGLSTYNGTTDYRTRGIPVAEWAKMNPNAVIVDDTSHAGVPEAVLDSERCPIDRTAQVSATHVVGGLSSPAECAAIRQQLGPLLSIPNEPDSAAVMVRRFVNKTDGYTAGVLGHDRVPNASPDWLEGYEEGGEHRALIASALRASSEGGTGANRG